MKKINRDTNWFLIVVIFLLEVAVAFSLYINYVNNKRINDLYKQVETVVENFELKNNELSTKIDSISKVRSRTVYTNVILKLEGGSSDKVSD